LFSEVAGRHGDNLAVKSADSSLTYRTLNALSSRLARRIIGALGGANEPVAALLDEGIHTPLALVSILRAGKIYVPLDAGYPQPRLEYVLADVDARLILTDRLHEEFAVRLARGRKILLLDEEPGNVQDDTFEPRIDADSLATILYTSGSTGAPKGVVNSHRQIVYSSIVRGRAVGMKSGDTVSTFMSFAFAGGMKIHAAALAHGAAVIDGGIRNLGGIADFFQREQTSIGALSPSILRHFLSCCTGRHSFPRLRVLYTAGEPLRPADVRLFRQVFPSDVRLLNILGMAETSWVRQFAADDAGTLEGDVVPVGYEFGDAEVTILDEEGRQLAAGRSGRIAAKSRYAAVGYWRRPEATKAAFLEDSDGSGKRTYLTGDIGYLDEDGCLVCTGRADLRLKVRDVGINPTEVEAALCRHPGVRDAVIAVREDRPGDERLVAYLISVADPPSATQMRHFLAGALPGHMVPSVFVCMEAFPLNSNGKLDRTRLPAPGQRRPELDTPFVEPRTPVERILAGIFAESLRIDVVGVDDDFFDLGGHSLIMARAVTRVNTAFGIEVPLMELFARPTIARLAPEIARSIAETRSSEHVSGLLDEIERMRDTSTPSDREER
jgi:amino acid adenylation domain-containing protein